MSKSRSDLNITDVHDGKLYQTLISSPGNSGIITLTCTFNTDGAALFHSSKRSFWPILCFINEFPPHLRFKYVILAGLWIGTKEPTPAVMNMYLQPFVQQLNVLNTTGFEWMYKEGKTLRFLLKPLLCNVDSVARPILQNRVQYNGRYGCSWCYSFGDYVGGSIRFLLKEEDPKIRTHDSHITDMNAAIKIVQAQEAKVIKKKKSVNGVKGYSVLSNLKTLDMVWGFPRDYLHADLIGVVLQLWNIWTESKGPIHITKLQVNQINERLLKMTPLHEIHRLIRPLKTEKNK